MAVKIERMEELAAAAAEAFVAEVSPFDGDWLAEHEVTSDECLCLSELIADLLSAWVHLPPDARALLVSVGAFSRV